MLTVLLCVGVFVKLQSQKLENRREMADGRVDYRISHNAFNDWFI
jgi:hypothetical protein